MSNKSRDIRQSGGWGKYLQHIGWAVEEIKNKKPGIKVYVKKIPLLGAVIKIQRPAGIPPIEEIDRIARKHRALFVKLEPQLTTNYQLLTTNGFEPDPSPNLPTKTIIIDLTKSEGDLWKNLSQDARQSVRKAQSYKLQVANFKWGEPGFEKSLDEFHRLLKETGRRQGFWTPGLVQLQAKAGAFDQNAILFLIQPEPSAGAFFLRDGETVYYHHAGSSPEGREKHAPYLLLWEAIKFFRNSAKRLDLEGVSDPRFPKQTKRWSGFTIFKNKFGGQERNYPAPLIKHSHPLTRILFKFANKIS